MLRESGQKAWSELRVNAESREAMSATVKQVVLLYEADAMMRSNSFSVSGHDAQGDPAPPTKYVRGGGTRDPGPSGRSGR